MTRSEPLAEKPYEELIQLLDESLRKLESNSLTLEDSIAEYDVAVEIASLAMEVLENAELRVIQISSRLETHVETNNSSDSTEVDW